MTIANKIAQLALGYSSQDITEIEPNQGWTDKTYEAEMKATGWEKGDEWCAAAAILCWKQACQANPELWAIVKKLVSLNSQEMAHKFHDNEVWPTSVNVPKIGAMVIWQNGNSAISGHCGIVVAINGKQFTSVEGNTTSLTRPNPNPGMNEREG